MNRFLRLAPLVPLTLLVAAAPPAATGRDKVFCVFGDAAKPVPCILTDTASRTGHRMIFAAGKQRALFVGRNNSAWWSGQLNGKPAMGHETNRGHTVYSTTDLRSRFEWWYPGSNGN